MYIVVKNKDSNGNYTTEMKKVKKAIDEINNIISDEITIVIFVGNGISPPDLSMEVIPENFLHDFRKKHPKRFIELFDDADIFVNDYLSRGKISGVKMDVFLEKLNRFEEIKKRFYSYLKLLCCETQATDKHFSLYWFCCLLNALRAKDDEDGLKEGLFNAINKKIPVLRIFTTNYDNLLEKAYRFRHSKKHPELWMNKVGKEHEFDKEKNYDDMEAIPLIPDYLFDFDDLDYKSGFLLIVPIHNSIRATICDYCNETMVSEMSGLGEEYCIYCGSKLPEFIIPTQEGRVNESLLNLMSEEFKKAQIIMFVGYSFGDRHIMDDIADAINESEGEKKLVINFCKESINKSKEFKKVNKKEKIKNVVDITYPLPHSLDYANHLLSEKLKSVLSENSKVLKMIIESYGGGLA